MYEAPRKHYQGLEKSYHTAANAQPVPMPAGEIAQQREETASVSGAGWDTEDDLTEQLSNQAINGAASRATSIDSRATSIQETKGWGSDDDWGDQDQPQPKARQNMSSSDGMPIISPVR